MKELPGYISNFIVAVIILVFIFCFLCTYRCFTTVEQEHLFDQNEDFQKKKRDRTNYILNHVKIQKMHLKEKQNSKKDVNFDEAKKENEIQSTSQSELCNIPCQNLALSYCSNDQKVVCKCTEIKSDDEKYQYFGSKRLKTNFSSLSSFGYEKETHENEFCSVCLGDFREGDDICSSINDQCTHFFHQECIIEWLLYHNECPICRRHYLKPSGDLQKINETSYDLERGTVQSQI